MEHGAPDTATANGGQNVQSSAMASTKAHIGVPTRRGSKIVSGKSTMKREEALERIARLTPQLQQMGVASLYVFGSVARGEAGGGSDIDLFVEFDRPVGLVHFVRIRDFLSRELGVEVDLVTRDALSADLRDTVVGEAIRAA